MSLFEKSSAKAFKNEFVRSQIIYRKVLRGQGELFQKFPLRIPNSFAKSSTAFPL